MTNIWKSQNIRLREITNADTSLFISENGDFDTETFQKYDYIDFPYSKEKIANRINGLNQTNSNNNDFNFVIELNEKNPIGFLTVFDTDIKNGTFKYGLFLKSDFKGKGYGSEAVRIVLNYYFNELRYNKVNVYIYDYNLPSIRFHEKMGFTYEGRLRQMSYSNGSYHDIIFYGMLKDEFNKTMS